MHDTLREEGFLEAPAPRMERTDSLEPGPRLRERGLAQALLERGRQQLFLDRLNFKRRVRETQEGLKAGGNLKSGDGNGLTFTSAAALGSVQPLGNAGNTKSYEA